MVSPSDGDYGGDDPSGSKRKADDQHNGSGKKKRSRVSYSCSECHRRKQKCNRQHPCQHCVARKVPELCHAYQPGKGDGDLHMRLARVEQILEMALPQFAAGGSPGGSGDASSMQSPRLQHRAHRERSPSSSPEDSNREEELPNTAGTLQENGRWFGATAMTSINSGPILDQFEDSRPVLSMDEAAAAAEKVKMLIQECGLAPHKPAELVQELPPKSLGDVLIDHFFRTINWTRYPIYEPLFRVSYEAIYANGVRVHPLDIRFLPLLFIVLAIAARLGPEQVVGDERQRRLSSLRYYWSSRRSMMIAAAIGEATELVLARLLTSRFLTFDRRITESWLILGNAVRTALSLGFHRDGAKLGLDPFQAEYRRRIWAYVYHADRTYALVFGRPPCVQDDYCDTLPPLNADDSALTTSSSSAVGHPLTEPTPMTIVILRSRLAIIIGHIVAHFQQVRPTHYSNVIALDEEIQNFIDRLPPHYAVKPDTSLDKTHFFLHGHRFLLVSEILFVRISLHRPYMLRKLDTDQFAFSRRVCFEAAKLDFSIRQEFKRSATTTVAHGLGGPYREFQAAMISGIYLAIDPHGPDALAMHKILDTFLSNHARPYEYDETTRRELKIIELLKTKSLSVAAGKPIHSPHIETRLGLDDDAPEMPGVSSMRSTNTQPPPPPEATMLLDLSRPRASASNPPPAPSFGTGEAGFSLSAASWLSRGLSSRPANLSLDGQRQPEEIDTTITSPSEEEESAQRLLDNWVNSAQLDSSTSFGLESSAFGGMEGDPYVTAAFGGRTDVHDGNLGLPSSGQEDPTSGDWSYWENLVEQIRASGS